MPETEYVTVVHTNDVLFGRGSGPNDHEGNIKFRDLVAQRKTEYMATNHRQTKAKIAKAIVDAVFSSNGRFLKKLEAAEAQRLGFSNGVDVYAVVDDDTIMEKAKQALRQNREKANANVNATTSNAGADKDAKAALASAMMSPPPAKIPSGALGNKPPSYPNQFEIPEPLPVRNIQPVPAYSADMQQNLIHQQHQQDQQRQQALYTDDEGYSTYTTTLEDPDDEKLFNRRTQMMEMSSGGSRNSGYSGSRRGSLLSARKEGRRESLQLADVWRRESMTAAKAESMQMSELMESFKGMSTTGDLNSSSDTIGTIDNMYPGNQMSGISNMSVISMSSATSLFKTASNENDSGRSSESPGDIFSGGAGASHRQRMNSSDMITTSTLSSNNHNANIVPNAATSSNGASNPSQPSSTANRQNAMPPPGTAAPRESLIPSEMWNSRNMQALLRAPIEGSSTNLAMGASADVAPRPVGDMSGNPDALGYLGASSMSVLRAAEQSSSSFRMPADFGGSNYDSEKNAGRILPPERK